MAVAPVAGLSTLSSAALPRSVSAAQTSGGPFSDVMARLINGANSQQLKADQSLEQFATGQVDSVHELVVAAANADLSFRLVLEIRNRLIESYQEIMRMQV